MASRLRTATPTDVPEMHALAHKVIDDVISMHYSATGVKQYKDYMTIERLEACLARGDHYTLMIKDDNIIGMAGIDSRKEWLSQAFFRGP